MELNQFKYYCELCNIEENNKFNYNIHLNTQKHKKINNEYKKNLKKNKL